MTTDRYAAVHESPNGPGDARPTAAQIIADEKAENSLAGKVILITGCSSGIGIDTAKALHKTGARLFLAVRNLAKGRTALAGSGILVEEGGRGELLEMDLGSLESVRKGAKVFLEKSGGKLNILVENAGIMGIPTLTLNNDGFEMHFATNHLGHFLLFNLVKDALIVSSTPSFHSRVVVLSSDAHTLTTIHDTGNYSFEKTPEKYDPYIAYGQSKLANIYMAFELERRFGSKGVHGLAVHPGGILDTQMAQNMPKNENIEKLFNNPEVMRRIKSMEQGASTTVLAAIGKEWEGKGGMYLADCGPGVPLKGDEDLISMVARNGYMSYIYDQELQNRLWKDSLPMVGLN